MWCTAECRTNYKILLLATLQISILTQKSNAGLGGPHFGSNSPLDGTNSSQMPVWGGGGGGGGVFELTGTEDDSFTSNTLLL